MATITKSSTMVPLIVHVYSFVPIVALLCAVHKIMVQQLNTDRHASLYTCTCVFSVHPSIFDDILNVYIYIYNYIHAIYITLFKYDGCTQ
jgi:hypothetical protein